MKQPLTALAEGEICKVNSLLTEGILRRRMLDLGLVEGTYILALHIGRKREIAAYLIRGAVIALRKEDAERIIITNISKYL